MRTRVYVHPQRHDHVSVEARTSNVDGEPHVAIEVGDVVMMIGSDAARVLSALTDQLPAALAEFRAAMGAWSDAREAAPAEKAA